MTDKKSEQTNLLAERMVRNDEIFCSLLYDRQNSTLRVVDFRGGNFQQKQDYLNRIQAAEGFRKIFTLIERDDMQGWQRCGYVREGSIPGYYRRSDAYIMGWLADADPTLEFSEDDEPDERKAHIQRIRDLAVEYAEYKTSAFRGEIVTQEEVPGFLGEEIRRREEAAKTARRARKVQLEVPSEENPLFMQFSRGVEYYYYGAINRRTRQQNLLAAEYQDCFGNAKLDLYFGQLLTKTDVALAKFGVEAFVRWLGEIGTVAIFALVDADNLEMNAIYAGCGFRNSGWLQRQKMRGDVATDQILWTLKLVA